MSKTTETAREYRVIVGERGNEQGHIVYTKARTDAGARRVMRRELAEYRGDGWARVEYRLDYWTAGTWERL